MQCLSAAGCPSIGYEEETPLSVVSSKDLVAKEVSMQGRAQDSGIICQILYLLINHPVNDKLRSNKHWVS